MPLRVSGRNMDIGDALRERMSTRITEALDKYFRAGCSGHVTVGRDGSGYRTECAIHLPSGITLEAEAIAANAYASADQAAERIEKRLRRYKRRLKNRQFVPVTGAHDFGSAGEPDAGPGDGHGPDADGEAEADAFTPVIIAETTATLPHLAVSDAVMQMDLSDRPFVVFRNASHGEINVVYRREDGHIGWIDLAGKKR
jgi:ribosomal subunit interface protein